jgi:hypothetical protein
MDEATGKLDRYVIVFLSGVIFALVAMERWRRRGLVEGAPAQTLAQPQADVQDETQDDAGRIQQFRRHVTGPIVAGVKAEAGQLRRTIGSLGKPTEPAAAVDLSPPGPTSSESPATESPAT